MTLKDIQNELNSNKYDFLKNNSHLGNNIIFLTLGGSYAYGTNVETSDIDIRGCTLNLKEDILTNQNFEQFINEDTDTTVYSFNKLITLLSNCNPNTIEMLGCKPEHYLYLTKIGKEFINNYHMFLSKKAIYSFGGYANQQLRRLDNKANRFVGQAQNEEHILNTIKCASYDFMNNYFDIPEDSIKLYIDKAIQEDYNTEIFMDINLKHYPLRDYKSMWSEMQSIVKSYSKIGRRNTQAIEHNKIGKHMMHLVRLNMMCIDILEKEKIITYRENEHDLLIDIRNGKYLDSNSQPTKEFYELLNDFEIKLNYAKNNTSLPNNPNYNKIKEFVMYVNEKIVKGDKNE